MAGTKNPSLQLNAAAAMAAAGNALKGFDDALAQTCIDTAIVIWNEEAASHEGTGTTDWNAAVELALATDEQVYKDRAVELLDTVLTTGQMGRNGWKAVRLIPIMDPDYEEKVLEAVEAYVPYLDSTVANNPFGVPNTRGMWGGSTGVVDMGARMSILHKYFPAVVSSEYTYRVMNYILGNHMYNDTSWLSGVGTSSVEVAYGSNRADHYYNAGGIVPGYVNIAPDFPEALDDFGFLWFESEYVIDTAAKWIVLANGASEFAAEEFNVKFESVGGSAVESATVASGKTLAEPAAPTKDGFNFDGWYVDAGCTVRYDFTKPVTGSFTLYAGWSTKSSGGGGSSVQQFTITAKQIEGGKISPATASVAKGGDKTFTITANEGYKISDVLVDGKSVGAVSTYTFKDVTANHTITAKFEKVEGTANVGGFIDVKSDDWFADAVQYAVDNGLMNGTSANTFSPKNATTRGMIVTILYRQAGSPAVESDKATWWSDARVWAMANGVSDGTNMDKKITREQLAAMLYRYAKLMGEDVSKTASLDGFKDGDKVSAYAVEALKWTAAEGIVTGKTGGIIDPQAGATRAETATMLMRFCELIK